jgi:NAD(P)H-dependent flavin oxidoreductase YrpB (nitropropane dioxygenase family)
MNEGGNVVRTKVCDLFGVEFPIFAFSHCRDVVAAVSRAGGIGVLGAAMFTPEQLDLELEWIQNNCDGRPYGVDVLFPSKYEGEDVEALRRKIPDGHTEFLAELAQRFGVPERRNPGEPSSLGGGDALVTTHARAREQIDVALKYPIAVAVSALGPFPGDIDREFRERGANIGGLAGRVSHARKHVESGADFIVATSAEAAGHTGDIGLSVLIPEVVDAVSPTPVIAAGGIADGRQIAAALALGAEGVWTGSIWLTTEESDVDLALQERLLAAKSEDTVRSRCASGKPVRQLRTDWTQAWEAPGAPDPLPMPLQGLLVRDFLISAYEHKIDSVVGTPVGQVVGLMKTRTSVRSTMHKLMEQYVAASERVCAQLD